MAEPTDITPSAQPEASPAPAQDASTTTPAFNNDGPIVPKKAFGESLDKKLREKLKQPEPAPEKVITGDEKPDEKKEEAKTPVAEEKPVKSEETPNETKLEEPEDLDKGAQESLADPHQKPKTKKRIQDLHSAWKKEESLRIEREKRIAELETAKPTTANTEELDKLKASAEAAEKRAKELEEKLLPYQRQYEVEASPEIEERFVKPAKAAEDRIGSILKTYNISDGTIKAIQDAGGLAAFSKSKKLYQSEDKQTGEKISVTGDFFVKDWLDSMSSSDGAAISAFMGEQARLEMQRQMFIDGEKGKAKEYFAGLTKKHAEHQEAATKQQKEMQSLVEKWYENVTSKDEIFKDPVLKEKLASILRETDIAKTLDYAKDAASATHLRSVVTAKDAKIAELEAALKAKDSEMDKVKNAGRSTPARANINGGSTATASDKPGKPLSFSERLDLRVRELAQA